MYQLRSTPQGGGRVTQHGEWPNYKTAVLVARAIQQADPSGDRQFSVYPGDRNASLMVPLTPPMFHADEAHEVAFSDGSIHWTDDLEQSFALANAILERDVPKLVHDMIYAITTNGCGTLYIEDSMGVQTSIYAGDDDSHTAFITAVTSMLEDVEIRVGL